MNLMPTMTESTAEKTAVELSADQSAALMRALELARLLAGGAPPEVGAYVKGIFLEAASIAVVDILFRRYTAPPPEPKRPRLTAPVRRGLMALAAGQSSGEDVARARQWISDEVAVSGDLVKTAPGGAEPDLLTRAAA